MNEADTCRKSVVPKLQSAGWDNSPYSIAEQRIFTNSRRRIRVIGGKIVRSKPKRTDYLLRYRLDFPLAIGPAEFSIPDALKVPPISELGNVGHVIQLFGGAEQLRAAAVKLQELLFAA